MKNLILDDLCWSNAGVYLFFCFLILSRLSQRSLFHCTSIMCISDSAIVPTLLYMFCHPYMHYFGQSITSIKAKINVRANFILQGFQFSKAILRPKATHCHHLLFFFFFKQFTHIHQECLEIVILHIIIHVDVIIDLFTHWFLSRWWRFEYFSEDILTYSALLARREELLCL